MTILSIWFAAFLTGCSTSEDQYGTCKDMCNELVGMCDYAAFPSYDSCLEGCAYNEEQGGDVEGQNECIQTAECDTFAIIECENQYGASSDE